LAQAGWHEFTNGKRPRVRMGAPTEADAPSSRLKQTVGLHLFLFTHFGGGIHVPPAFAQSASVFAAVTSPAKTGPVKASARINAKIEMRFALGQLWATANFQ
jgi:hypothetical protein